MPNPPQQESHGDPNGMETLAKRCSRSIAERISYRPDAKPSLLQGIDRGIFHLAAFWSGPAIRAFSAIGKTIEDIDHSKALTFIVADIDGSHAFSEIPDFGAVMGGWGETAWVRSGKIVFQTGKSWTEEQFREYTAKLIDMD